MIMFVFTFSEEHCEDVTYIDYNSNTNYNFAVLSSSNEADAINALKDSTSQWTATASDSTDDDQVWIKFQLNVDENNLEPAIRDIWLSVSGAKEVRMQYTFRELPTQPDLDLPPALDASTGIVHVDVDAISAQTQFSVTAVKILILTDDSGIIPSVSNLMAQVCFNPYQCELFVAFGIVRIY